MTWPPSPSGAPQEKREARKKRQKVRQELGKDAPPALQPHTIETLRIPNVTAVQPEDLETQQADRLDELGGYFSRETPPKVMLTAGDFPSAVSWWGGGGSDWGDGVCFWEVSQIVLGLIG